MESKLFDDDKDIDDPKALKLSRVSSKLMDSKVPSKEERSSSRKKSVSSMAFDQACSKEDIDNIIYDEEALEEEVNAEFVALMKSPNVGTVKISSDPLALRILDGFIMYAKSELL